MAIVVGYVPTKEGRAALRRAADESLLRKTKLIVINSSRGGKDYDGKEADRFEAELKRVQDELDQVGIEHEVRHLVRGNEPAEDLIAVADEEGADFIVIGLRRRTPVGKLILGSNAQRILLDASCPVLAVTAGACPHSLPPGEAPSGPPGASVQPVWGVDAGSAALSFYNVIYEDRPADARPGPVNTSTPVVVVEDVFPSASATACAERVRDER